MKKTKSIISYIIFFMVIVLTFSVPVNAADTYKVTYNRGYYFYDGVINNKELDYITGSLPSEQTVSYGGSIVAPAKGNLKFRDYEFAGWIYEYKGSDDKTYSVVYQPGETISNITGNMTLKAKWERKEVDLEIYGFMTYINNEPYVDGSVPEGGQVKYLSETTLKSAGMSKDGYDFIGWVDSDSVVYQPGGKYTANKINPVLTAAWQKKGDAVLTHKVIYEKGASDVQGDVPPTYELYKKTEFIIADNTLNRNGYAFKYWEDKDGNIYKPGSTVQAAGTETRLTAVWEVVETYYNITVGKNDGGTVEPSSAEVPEGGSAVINITPEAGYRIKSIKVNGSDVAVTETLELTGITENKSIVVEFALKGEFGISLNTSAGGTAYVEGGKSKVTEGETIIIVMEPENGYAIKKVTVNGEEIPVTSTKLELRDITDDLDIQITYKLRSEIEDESSAGGSSNGSNKFLYLTLIIIALVLLVAGGAMLYLKNKK